MSRAGECYGNATVESFSGTLKQELVHQAPWRDLTETRAALCEYIEVSYSRQRLHSSLDYRAPIEVDLLAA